MNLESIRSGILMMGWPLLVLGSGFFVFHAVTFYKKTHKLALGKLIISNTVGQLISMYSLGVIATIFMLEDLEVGVKVVIPIFLFWALSMVLIFYISSKWSGEASKINILYYKIKERTDELKNEKTKLSHIAQNMATGAILLDNEGKVMFINNEAKNILKFKSENNNEILGALFEKFSKYNLKEKTDRCLAGKPSNIIDAEVNGKIYEIFLRCLTDDKISNNIFFGHFIWIRDVTEEKTLEVSKNKFITVASHKLRTPLTSIRTFTEMLANNPDNNLNEGQKEYLLNIQNSTNLMVKLVDELLKLSELKTDKIKINLKDVDLKEVAKESINKISNSEEGRGCKIVYLSEAIEAKTKTDPELVGEVMETLLRNAAMYSNPDSLCDIEVEIDNKRTGELVISVRDSGIGIPEEDYTKVFKKFFRSDNAIKKETEGTGIGLHTAKAIIEALDGKIWFDSEVGKGSKFYISLPIK